MFTPESAAINTIVDSVNSQAQNIHLEENISVDKNVYSSTERASRQSICGHINRQLCNKGTVNKSSDHEVDTTRWSDSEQQIREKVDSDWKLDISDEESEAIVDVDWVKIPYNRQKNLVSPIVVEIMSDKSSSLNVPRAFEQPQNMQSEGDNTRTAVENEAQASPVSRNANEADEIEDHEATDNSELEDTTVTNNVASANSSPARKGCVKSPIGSALAPQLLDNSGAKTCDIPRLEDTSALQHQRDCSTETEDNAATSSSTPKNSTIVTNTSSLDCSPIHSRRSRRLQPLMDSPDLNNSSAPSRKKSQMYSIRNIVIVIMESGSGFCFSGKLQVNVLYGVVEVYGAILAASTDPVEVYSPKGYSSVVVETSNAESPRGNIKDVWTALIVEGITRDSESQLQESIDKVEPGMAVLVLRNIENNLTHFLKTHCPYQLFPSVKNSGYYSWVHRQRAEMVLQAYFHNDPTRRRLTVNPHIIGDIVDGMLARWRANSWSCALVAGGKSVGKSTSVRFLINRLLHTCAKVVLVDVDPGQAECTPAGCLSYSLIEQPLTGPNFTHLQTPAYQLFIDEINVAQCVTRYLEGVKMLVDKLRQCPELSGLPVVVNTMGFTQHIGWDLAIFTVKLVRPSVILQIRSTKKNRNYATLLTADIVNKQERTWTFCDEQFIDWDKPCDHELYVIDSDAEDKSARAPSEWNMEPYQQRELVMISYLSGITRNHYDRCQYNVDLSLGISEAVPCMSVSHLITEPAETFDPIFRAPFSSLCIIPQRLFGVPASHALSVINGNIVALCGIDLTEESSQESDGASGGLRVLTQRSPLCTCYGFGVVRGVDMERQLVFINTPLPMTMMQHVNCLAGCIPIPPALLRLSQGAPYVGRDATLPTSRVAHPSYFRIKHRRRPSNS